jgi:hypothetical protein
MPKVQTIKRSKHERNFLTIHNSLAQNSALSYEARGLLIELLSRPDDWEVNIANLKVEGKAGRQKVIRIINELIQAGYIEDKRRIRQSDGTFDYTPYIVYDKPLSRNPLADNPSPENQHLQSTEEQKTDHKDSISFSKEEKEITRGENSIEETKPPMGHTIEEEGMLERGGVFKYPSLENERDTPPEQDYHFSRVLSIDGHGDEVMETVPAPAPMISARRERLTIDLALQHDPDHICSPLSLIGGGMYCQKCGRRWYDEGCTHPPDKLVRCVECNTFAYDGGLHETHEMEDTMLEWETGLCADCLEKKLRQERERDPMLIDIDELDPDGLRTDISISPGGHIAILTAPEQCETKVAHFHDVQRLWWQWNKSWTDPNIVYIGRANTTYDLPQSDWANPFLITSEQTREEVITRYEEYIRKNPELMARLSELEGKTLVCWCKKDDRDAACHGDVLLKLLRELRNGKETERNVTKSATSQMVTSVERPDTENITRLIDAHTAMKNAIVAAFGWKTEDVTDAIWGIINKTSAELRKVDAAPEDMPALAQFCKSKEWGTNMTPRALSKWWAEYKKANTVYPAYEPPVHPTDVTPRTDEEIAELQKLIADTAYKISYEGRMNEAKVNE